jgi:hypothetical protein
MSLSNLSKREISSIMSGDFKVDVSALNSVDIELIFTTFIDQNFSDRASFSEPVGKINKYSLTQIRELVKIYNNDVNLKKLIFLELDRLINNGYLKNGVEQFKKSADNPKNTLSALAGNDVRKVSRINQIDDFFLVVIALCSRNSMQGIISYLNSRKPMYEKAYVLTFLGYTFSQVLSLNELKPHIKRGLLTSF